MHQVPIPVCHALNHLLLPSLTPATQLFNFLCAEGGLVGAGGWNGGTRSLMLSIIPLPPSCQPFCVIQVAPFYSSFRLPLSMPAPGQRVCVLVGLLD